MVFIEPPSSRMQLEWGQLSDKGGGSWCLNLPPYYATLFEIQEPRIMAKSNTGWRESRSGKTKYAFFINLDAAECEIIKKFQNDYKRFIIIGLNRRLVGFKRSELTGCLALDYNFSGPGGEYTEVGQLENDAKYHQSQEALDLLIVDLVQAVRRIPGIIISPEPRFITSIPSSDANPNAYCLPKLLCEGMISFLDNSIISSDTPFVQTRFRARKRKLKGLTLDQKQLEWSKILQNRGIEISQPVKDSTILIVDDLYQSGTTIWNMAKYLREVEGVAEVFGLVCVKSLRDTDNR